ncbi:hypothetical protein PR048_002024 [Dryococelus australis]|uniref:Uncharacterized protein n=1 Tax=Dryococelus australis TaxID=614101 RepID=A0ABQ9IKE2_9NEOP|nr:hypothetical protein PR048_002024 [Dryococelus australis]
MDRSGLNELMCTIYAPVSFDKMLQHHAFARVVRAHLLIQTALSNIILEQLDISVEEPRDATDIAKVSLWFASRSPFPVTDEIATGAVGNNEITCYDALAVDKQAIANVVCKHFTDVKLSRKDRALPLANMTCSVKMYDAKVAVDHFLIFQRISISKKTNDYLKTYLQHESASFPLDLFDKAGMRKTKKCAIYDIFEEREKNVDLHNFDIVMDGEYLLHKVGWRRGPTCLTIYQSYLDYILKYYSGKSCTVVFDSYSSTAKSTKDVEQT